VASAIISAGRTIRLIGLPLLAIQLQIDPAETSFIFGITGFIDFSLFYLSGIIMARYWQVLVRRCRHSLALGTTYLFSFMVTDVATFWIMASVTALANAGFRRNQHDPWCRSVTARRKERIPGIFQDAHLGWSGNCTCNDFGADGKHWLSRSALQTTGLLNFVGAFLFWRYLPIYAPDKKEK
jgi:hypothetical protein